MVHRCVTIVRSQLHPALAGGDAQPAANQRDAWKRCGLGGDGEKGSRVLPDHLPHQQGFEKYFRGQTRDYHASHDLAGSAFLDAPRVVRDDRFRVTVQTEAALSFLERRAAHPQQPWFLYLA